MCNVLFLIYCKESALGRIRGEDTGTNYSWKRLVHTDRPITQNHFKTVILCLFACPTSKKKSQYRLRVSPSQYTDTGPTSLTVIDGPSNLFWRVGAWRLSTHLDCICFVGRGLILSLILSSSLQRPCWDRPGPWLCEARTGSRSADNFRQEEGGGACQHVGNVCSLLSATPTLLQTQNALS